MEENFGIEVIKEAALVAIKFGQKLDDALEDDKITWGEGLGLVFGIAPEVFSLVPKIGQIKDEYKDLSDAERQELVDYVVANLDLANDRVEAITEKAFAAVVALEDLVATVRA